MIALHFFVTAFGLGYGLKLLGTNRIRLGLQLYIGFVLIPILMTALNLSLGMPLDMASGFVTGMGLSLSVLFLYQNRSRFREIPIHPFLGFYLIFCICFWFFDAKPYYSSEWDEYSHWLTMPKQMFLHREIYDPNFLTRELVSYTPAWPLSVIFHDLLIGNEFKVVHGLWVTLIGSLFSIAALLDLTRGIFREEVKKLKDHRAFFVLALVICGGVLFSSYTPTSVTVEKPMTHVSLMMFALIGVLFKRKKKELRMMEFWILGIFLAYAYLLKITFMTLVPVLGVAVIFLGENWKKRILFGLATFLPFLGVYLLWKHHLTTHELNPLFSPVSVTNPEALLVRFKDRIEILQKLPGAIFWTLKRTLPFKFLGIAAFLFYFVKKRDYKNHALGLLTCFYLVFYLLCLVWMYFVSFGEYEAKNLASFGRYMSIPLTLMLYFGLWKLLLELSYRYRARLKFKTVTWARSLIGLAVFVCFLVSSSHARGNIRPLYGDMDTIRKVIEEYKLMRPSVLIISQGSDQLEIQIGRYLSIGPDRYEYEVDTTGVSFGPMHDNVWRQSVTEEQMIQRIFSNQIVWMIQTDDWMERVLKRLPFRKPCTSAWSDSVIVKVGTEFDCVRKSAAKVKVGSAQ